jgi:hypothetical protein
MRFTNPLNYIHRRARIARLLVIKHKFMLIDMSAQWPYYVNTCLLEPQLQPGGHAMKLTVQTLASN